MQKITTNEKIKFEWDLSELTEKIVDGASIPVEFEKTDYDADDEEVFNNALLTKEISFAFKGQDDVGCDLQDRLYGRNATPIKLKITTELCKEEVEKVDTVRKVNQVQLR